MSAAPQIVTVLAAACDLAANHGIRVFPCRVDNKRPLTTNGFYDASSDLEKIETWWSERPDALVAVPTGGASRLLVIDIDPAGADWYTKNSERLACARVHKTRRGHHLVYRMPDAYIRNSASKIARGVDVRAEGGYVIWWPAHGYDAVGDLEDVTEPPAWLLKLLTSSETESTKKQGNSSAPSLPPLGGNGVANGSRNSTLTSLAGKMRRAGASQSEIETALSAFNQRCSPPLSEQEVQTIARSVSRYPAGNDPLAPSGAKEVGTLVRLRGSEIKAKRLDPIWPGVLYKGKVMILAGLPGDGKSALTCDIVSRITRGSTWPCSTSRAQAGCALLLTAEDDPEDTIRPRMDVAGADPDKYEIITGVRRVDMQTGESTLDTVSLIADLPKIEAVIVETGAVALVVDPLTSFATSDTNKTADMRRLLDSLADLARRTGCCIVIVTHLNKRADARRAMHMIAGSHVIVAAVRTAFATARDPNDPARRLVLPLKLNIAKEDGGFAFRMEDTQHEVCGSTPRVVWEAPKGIRASGTTRCQCRHEHEHAPNTAESDRD